MQLVYPGRLRLIDNQACLDGETNLPVGGSGLGRFFETDMRVQQMLKRPRLFPPYQPTGWRPSALSLGARQLVACRTHSLFRQLRADMKSIPVNGEANHFPDASGKRHRTRISVPAWFVSQGSARDTLRACREGPFIPLTYKVRTPWPGRGAKPPRPFDWG